MRRGREAGSARSGPRCELLVVSPACPGEEDQRGGREQHPCDEEREHQQRHDADRTGDREGHGDAREGFERACADALGRPARERPRERRARGPGGETDLDVFISHRERRRGGVHRSLRSEMPARFARSARGMRAPAMGAPEGGQPGRCDNPPHDARNLAAGALMESRRIFTASEDHRASLEPPAPRLHERRGEPPSVRCARGSRRPPRVTHELQSAPPAREDVAGANESKESPMAYKHLLVHVDGGSRAADRLDVAVALAARLGARLTGLFAELHSLGPSLVARRSPQNMAEASRSARALFEAKSSAAPVVAEWWELPPGEYGEVVPQAAACCRYADLAILGQHEGEGAAVPE